MSDDAIGKITTVLKERQTGFRGGAIQPHVVGFDQGTGEHQALRLHRSAAAALAFGILASLSVIPQANAQTASGLVSSWGNTCKMRVVEQFDVPMSDALVTIGATEQQSINQGSTSLKDIKNNGMSDNWEIRGKKVSGSCNVNGKGKITEFKQGL